MKTDLGEDILILTWFASRSRAERYETYRRPDDTPFDELTHRVARYLIDAMRRYALVGRTIYLARMEVEGEPPLRADPVPGLNDPCPCGSGRKYKRCCGEKAH